MQQFQPLWEFINAQNRTECKLSFDSIESILGFPLDHSFLSAKKQLNAYGFRVKKFYLAEKTEHYKKTKNPINQQGETK